MLLSGQDNWDIDKAFKHLHQLNCITSKLQKGYKTLASVHTKFDTIVHAFPWSNVCLSSSAEILNDCAFETSTVKPEQKQISSLLFQEETPKHVFPKWKWLSKVWLEIIFLWLVLERYSKKQAGINIYVDTVFLTSTSSLCERLFLNICFGFTDHGRLETLIKIKWQMSYANRKLWSIKMYSK